MSVTIITRFHGDTAKFRRDMVERAERYREIRDKAIEVGALHHSFAVADDYVLVIDEWETAEQSRDFFAQPWMQEHVASCGADLSVPPEIWAGEAVASPDKF